MSDEAEFKLKLTDDVSRAGKKVAGAFNDIRASATSLERSMKRHNVLTAEQQALADKARAAGKAVERQQRNNAKAYKTEARAAVRATNYKAAATGKYAKTLYGMKGGKFDGVEPVAASKKLSKLDTAFGGVAGRASLAGGAVVGFYGALGYLGARLGMATVETMRFKDEALTGLTLITRSADRANRVFDDSVKLSDDLGISWRDTVSGMQKLLAKGFEQGFAEDLIRGTADLKIASPDANIGNLLLAIGQIKTAGKLQGDELNQLTEAGLNSALMFQQLEKRLGKSRQEVLKLKEQGQLMADDVLPAILDSIRSMTGKGLGQASKDATKTLAGQLRKLEQLPERFFLKVSDAADKAGLSDTLSRIWEKIGTDSALFERTVSWVAEALNAGLPLVEAFADAFLNAFGHGMDQSLDGFIETLKDPATLEAVADFGNSVGAIAGNLVDIGFALAPVITGMLKLASLALSPLGGWETKGKQVGQGLADGIRSKTPEIREAGWAAGRAGVDGAAAGAGTRSPSRLTFATGVDVDRGLELGMEKRLPRIEAVANDVGAASVGAIETQATAPVAPVAAGSAVPAPSSAPRTMQVDVGGVTVVVQTDGQGGLDEEQLFRQVQRALNRALAGLEAA